MYRKPRALPSVATSRCDGVSVILDFSSDIDCLGALTEGARCPSFPARSIQCTRKWFHKKYDADRVALGEHTYPGDPGA